MDSTFSSDFRCDLARWFGPAHPVSPWTAALSIMTHPGLQAVLLLRIQSLLVLGGHRRLARVVSMANLRLTGAEFLVGCRIGPGLVMRHPQGIVVGNGVVVGRDCYVLHRVTMGERYADGGDPRHEYPSVGDRVVIGVGSVVLGGVTVGDGAVIGANSVVVRDVGAGDVVVGVPARSTRPGSASQSGSGA